MKKIREVKYTGIKSMKKVELKDGEKVRLMTPDNYEWMSYWVWNFRIKSEDEKDPTHAHAWQGIYLKPNPETNEAYFLIGWEKGYYEAMNKGKIWVPEGEIKAIKTDDLQVMSKRYLNIWRIRHPKKKAPVQIG